MICDICTQVMTSACPQDRVHMTVCCGTYAWATHANALCDIDVIHQDH